MQIGMFRKGLLSLALGALFLTAPPAVACEGESLTPPELTAETARSATLCLMNERRHKAGAGKLRIDSRLEQAAQTHSDSMNAENFFAHDSPSGGGPVDRIRNAGYLAGAKAWGIAENIRWGSAGQASPRSAVRAWMKSPPHRHAMLDRSYRQVGIGIAFGTPAGPAEDGAIYTADFGYRK
jgi:uncharacterized protein YkwD